LAPRSATISRDTRSTGSTGKTEPHRTRRADPSP
jgi:hypothetical protein